MSDNNVANGSVVMIYSKKDEFYMQDKDKRHDTSQRCCYTVGIQNIKPQKGNTAQSIKLEIELDVGFIPL